MLNGIRGHVLILHFTVTGLTNAAVLSDVRVQSQLSSLSVHLKCHSLRRLQRSRWRLHAIITRQHSCTSHLALKYQKTKHASAEFYEPAINLLQWCAGNNEGDRWATRLLFVSLLMIYFDIHVSGCCLIFTRLIFNVISSLGSVS